MPTRLPGNPILTTMSHPSLGDNVNGPSLIRAPDWLPNPLGKYYLYFAHHKGRFIRLAVADELEGPWRVHPPGVLSLAASGFEDHVASPDVHVDHRRRRIMMYVHGVLPAPRRPRPEDAELADPFYVTQRTRLAESSDGLTFAAHEPVLAAAYLRAWRWRGKVYALAMPGLLYRADDWHGPFERGPMILQDRATAERALRENAGMVRHSAVRLVPAGDGGSPDTLEIHFTRGGDAPERVLMSRVVLHDDWRTWRAGEPVEVLRPETAWEGADCPRIPSRRGPVQGPAWQLRDPAIFEDQGAVHLVYAIAGEQGLAIARL